MEAFERVYRRYLDKVFRYAWRCVGRREIAEEITSEAFLALYEHLDQIDEARLPAWLLTVVKNRSVDYWRRSNLERDFASEAAASDPKTSQPARELWLLEARDLKPIHRMCLILRYVHGMDRNEIARETGLSEMQVKGLLQYARELVRKHLEEHR